jgi:arabinofuranosyltransferase
MQRSALPWMLVSALLICLILFEFLRNEGREPGAPAAPASGAADRLEWVIAAGFVAVVAVATSIQLLTTWRSFIDDAYISFRYADNLASGYGLRWNRQDAPTEGFTNLLFVLMLAPHRALGIDPLALARAFSLVSLGVLLFLLYRVARRELPMSPAIATISAAAFLACGRSIEIALNGLETMLFAMLFFLCFERLLAYYRSGGARTLGLIGALSFIAILVRPEGVFVPIAITVTAVVSARWRDPAERRGLLLLWVGFGAPTLAYVLWKQLYFGSIVPNTALVKIPAAGHFIREQGIEAINEYLDGHRHLLLAGLAALLVGVPGRHPGRLAAAILFSLFVLFFVHVDPLMNIDDRFLYPVTPLLLYLALPTFDFLARSVADAPIGAVARPIVAILLLCVVSFRLDDFPVAYGRMFADRNRPWAQPEARFGPLARALAQYPGVADLSIASVDAGLVPYFTRAYHIDLAGLNTRFIAEHHDSTVISDYVFAQRPVLIIYRTRKDGGFVTYGHGPLGDERTWATNPGWDQYVYAGTADQPDVHRLNLFVRWDWENRASLVAYLQTHVVDYVLPEAPVALGQAAVARSVDAPLEQGVVSTRRGSGGGAGDLR